MGFPIWLLGVLLAVGASIVSNLGLNLQVRRKNPLWEDESAACFRRDVAHSAVRLVSVSQKRAHMNMTAREKDGHRHSHRSRPRTSSSAGLTSAGATPAGSQAVVSFGESPRTTPDKGAPNPMSPSGILKKSNGKQHSEYHRIDQTEEEEERHVRRDEERLIRHANGNGSHHRNSATENSLPESTSHLDRQLSAPSLPSPSNHTDPSSPHWQAPTPKSFISLNELAQGSIDLDHYGSRAKTMPKGHVGVNGSASTPTRNRSLSAAVSSRRNDHSARHHSSRRRSSVNIDGVQVQEKKKTSQGHYTKQPIWILGLICVILGSLLDFTALAFVDQAVVAPLGSLTLVSNVFFAPLLLKEKVNRKQLYCTALIIAGSILAVAFAPHSNNSPDIQLMFDNFARARFIVYAIIVVASLAGLRFACWKFNLIRRNDPFGAYVKVSRYHTFCYAACAGIMGAQSVLFAKCWGVKTRLMTFDGRSVFVTDIIASMRRGETIELMGDDGTVRRTIAGSDIVGNTSRDPKSAAKLASIRDGHAIHPGPPSVAKGSGRRGPIGGKYECKFDGCTKTFNTNSDRGKHEELLHLHRTPAVEPSMYKITPHTEGREAFTCNGSHTLVVEIDGAVVEHTVEQFLALPKASQMSAKMVQPDTVQFGHHGKSLAQRLLDALIDVHPAIERAALVAVCSPPVVAHTAWVIGMWLTDGHTARTEVVQIQTDSYPTVNGDDRSHTAVVVRLAEWYDIVMLRHEPLQMADDPEASPIKPAYTDEDAPDSTSQIVTGHPQVRAGNRVTRQDGSEGNRAYRVVMGPVLAHVLKTYEIFCKKRVPHQLLAETVDVRMALLAGIVDGGGHSAAYRKAGITLAAKRRTTIDSVVHLVRGLGLYTGKVGKTVATAEDGSTYNGYRVSFNGSKLAQLKTELLYKRYTLAECNAKQRGRGFTVTKIGHGKYYGFQVDGNGRLLLDDFVVTHNVSQTLQHSLSPSHRLLISLLIAVSLHRSAPRCSWPRRSRGMD